MKTNLDFGILAGTVSIRHGALAPARMIDSGTDTKKRIRIIVIVIFRQHKRGVNVAAGVDESVTHGIENFIGNFVEESRFMTVEDRQIMKRLKENPDAFGNGGSSMFTQGMIKRVALGWATNVSEVPAEGKRLFGSHYLSVRFEDLLASPFEVMQRLWRFLGARRPSGSLRRAIDREMHSNPDEEWQARRNADVATFLHKGRAGSWRHLLTERDRAVFKAVAGQALIDWNYESSLNWG